MNWHKWWDKCFYLRNYVSFKCVDYSCYIVFHVLSILINKHEVIKSHDYKIIKCLSTFIIHMTHIKFLLTHILRHLTLLWENLCIEISIRRPTPVMLLIVNPHSHTHNHLNISLSHSLLWQGKSIWSSLIRSFKPQTQSNESPSNLTNFE